MESTKPVCKFFIESRCKFGEKCHYYHQQRKEQLFCICCPVKIVCPFFMKGRCKFGEKCKSYHPTVTSSCKQIYHLFDREVLCYEYTDFVCIKKFYTKDGISFRIEDKMGDFFSDTQYVKQQFLLSRYPKSNYDRGDSFEDVLVWLKDKMRHEHEISTGKHEELSESTKKSRYYLSGFQPLHLVITRAIGN